MRKGLFVLDQDLSGLNRFLFASLRDLGWDVRSAIVGFPTIRKLALAAGSFRPDRGRWRRRYHHALETFATSDEGVAARTAVCSRLLRERAQPDDLVMTIGVLFDPRRLSPRRPYVAFKDYTTALARRGRGEERPARTGVDFQRWIDHEARLCQGAERVFTASENTRRSVVADYGVPEERVVAVYEGVCFDALPPPPASKDYDLKTILFIGKDFERKGGPTVLAAFEAVRRAVPEARLVVLGPERSRAVPAGVDWVGPIGDRDALQRFYARSVVFAMPSYREPFGLVFLEAMAHGLPCIGARRDAMPEIIEDGTTGFLVEPGDAAALADRILSLLGDPALARRLGAQGYERVRTRFRWSDVARRIDAELSRVAAR